LAAWASASDLGTTYSGSTRSCSGRTAVPRCAAWPSLRAAFGEIRPAATMIQAGLADPRMRIEIEVDAIIGSA
jgi:enamine deaminase RidA (YjgF/YER057c/UK114 family)